MSITTLVAQHRYVELVFDVSRNLLEWKPDLIEHLSACSKSPVEQAGLGIVLKSNTEQGHAADDDWRVFRMLVDLQKGPDNMSGHYAYSISARMQLQIVAVKFTVDELTCSAFGLVTSNQALLTKAEELMASFWSKILSNRTPTTH